MKRTLTIVFALLLTGTILSSCEKCGTPVITELTPSDAAWLVYAKGDSVFFTDEDNVPVKYIVTDSVTQTVAGEGLSPDKNCFDKLDTKNIVVLNDKAKRFPDLATYVYKTPSKLEVRLAVQDSDSKEVMEESPTHATLEVNGTTYNNVFEFNLQKTKPYSAKRILFNKEYGFLYIEFHDGTFLNRKQM